MKKGSKFKADRAADDVPDCAGTKLNFKAIAETVPGFRAAGTIPAAPMQAIRGDRKRRGRGRQSDGSGRHKIT